MKTKILLVEDEASARLMYRTQFEKDGFEVFEATNAKDGLALMKQHKPDIGLFDLVLQDQSKKRENDKLEFSGISLLEQVKQDEQLAHIPIIILTNLGRETFEARTKELGAHDYLVKSELLPSEVVDIVKQYITEQDSEAQTLEK